MAAIKREAIRQEEIKLVGPKEHGQRLIWCIQQVPGLTFEQLSDEVTLVIKGKKDGSFVSWYVSQKDGVGPKKVDPHRALAFAEALAGRGGLVDDARALWLFLMGIESDPRDVLSFQLQAVTPSPKYGLEVKAA